jgi:hypothetical protein
METPACAAMGAICAMLWASWEAVTFPSATVCAKMSVSRVLSLAPSP